MFQQREYMSVEEASKIIYTNETWNQYKDILMKRKVDALLRRDWPKLRLVLKNGFWADYIVIASGSCDDIIMTSTLVSRVCFEGRRERERKLFEWVNFHERLPIRLCVQYSTDNCCNLLFIPTHVGALSSRYCLISQC